MQVATLVVLTDSLVVLMAYWQLNIVSLNKQTTKHYIHLENIKIHIKHHMQILLY